MLCMYNSLVCLKGKNLKDLQIILFQNCLQNIGDFTKNFEIFILQANLSKQSKLDLGFSCSLKSPTEWFLTKCNLQLPGDQFSETLKFIMYLMKYHFP